MGTQADSDAPDIPEDTDDYVNVLRLILAELRVLSYMWSSSMGAYDGDVDALRNTYINNLNDTMS